MSTATTTSSIEIESDSLLQTLVDQMQFPEAVERWSRCINSLNRWEDSHLLVDNPQPEALARHKRIVERLMSFGQVCGLITSRPDFDDFETAGMVSATQQVLLDKLRRFHHPMSKDQADRILLEVFPES